MAAFFKVVWRRHRKLQSPPKLNNYPATPTGYYEGWFPGSSAVKSNRIQFRQRRQNLPEHNVFPVTSVAPAVVAWMQPPAFKINFRREHLTPEELNSYPATPAGYYEGWFPGSKAIQAYQVQFRRHLQQLPEHNVFPPTLSTSDFAAWVKLPTFKTSFKRKHLTPEELNNSPATLALSYIGLLSIINEYGAGALSTILSSGSGVMSSMDGSEGQMSMMQTSTKGVESAIDKAGKGVESGI